MNQQIASLVLILPGSSACVVLSLRVDTDRVRALKGREMKVTTDGLPNLLPLTVTFLVQRAPCAEELKFFVI